MRGDAELAGGPRLQVSRHGLPGKVLSQGLTQLMRGALQKMVQKREFSALDRARRAQEADHNLSGLDSKELAEQCLGASQGKGHAGTRRLAAMPAALAPAPVGLHLCRAASALMVSVSRQQSLARTPSGSESALGGCSSVFAGHQKAQREHTAAFRCHPSLQKSCSNGCTEDSTAFGDISALAL